MEQVQKQDKYKTSLASEYYVMSTLNRLGYDASITLGNRKAVDIVVEINGRVVTIDVKGMASKTNWLLDNFSDADKPNHFIVLVTFLGKFGDIQTEPEVYVVPANEVPRLLYINPKGNRKTLPYKVMAGNSYKNAWYLLNEMGNK